jgi:hypothetical protein
MRKQTNTLSPSPKGFQSLKFSDFREVRGLGRPKSFDRNVVNFDYTLPLLCLLSVMSNITERNTFSMQLQN